MGRDNIPLKVLLAVAVLSILVVPGGFAHYHNGDHRSYAYYISNVPEIYLKGQNGSLNLSFFQIALFQNGSYYSAGLHNVRWEHPDDTGFNYSYSGSVRFFHVYNYREKYILSKFLGTPIPPYSRAFNSIQSGNMFNSQGMSLNISITVKSLNLNGIFGINNTTDQKYGVFDVNIVMSSRTIHGSGTLGLMELLGEGGKVNVNTPGRTHFINNSSKSGVVVTADRIDGSYWWNDNYTLNGRNATLSVVKAGIGPYVLLVFKYNFSNGLNTLEQDPYLASPDFNFLNGTVVSKELRESELFLADHLRILLEGIGSGAVLLGIAYGSYLAGTGSLKKRDKIRRK